MEINVVPLSVRLTEKFYQMLQEFFLPKAEMEEVDQDHSHVFGGVQRMLIYSLQCVLCLLYSYSTSL